MLSSDRAYPNVNSQMEAWKYSKIENFLKLKHEAHGTEVLAKPLTLPEEIQSLLEPGAENIIFYNGQSKQHPGGLDLKIDDNSKSTQLNLVYLYGNRIAGETRPSRINLKNSITVEGRASLKIFEIHIALNDIEFSVEQNTEIVTSGDSKTERAKCFWLGDDSYTYDFENIEIKDKSEFTNLVIQMGGKWSRIEQQAKLQNEGASYKSLGAYLLGGSGHCDLTTNIEHVVGHTNSEQLFKGLVTEKARAAFSGRILIHQDAQKSSTSQLNQNVVLGERAEADSRPQLEVYADDVTASHGSTIGGLSESEIFYLQSRGLSKGKATEMVAKAFVDDLAERLENENLRLQASRILNRGFQQYIQSALEDS